MPSPSANTYATSSTMSDWKGLSAALNRDDKRRFMRGGMGNLRIMLETGQPILFDWDFIGGWQANPTDTAQLSGISFEDIVAPTFDGSARLTIASSTAFKISKAEINLNNSPFARQDPNAAGGYCGGWLNNPKPTLTLDPEAVTIATRDWSAGREAVTEFTVVFVAGTSSGNICTITCTNVEVPDEPEEQNRNGMIVDALNCAINGVVTVAWS
jgi:hypothetical protein